MPQVQRQRTRRRLGAKTIHRGAVSLADRARTRKGASDGPPGARLLEELAEYGDTYRYGAGVLIKACAQHHEPRR